MPAKGFIITTLGDSRDFSEEFTLENIYEAMEVTHIETLELGKGVTVCVDGEGLLKESNPNVYGTAVAEALSGWRRMHLIHGNMLFFGGQQNGNILPLTEDQHAQLIYLLSQSKG